MFALQSSELKNCSTVGRRGELPTAGICIADRWRICRKGRAMYANHKRLQMSSSFPHFLDLARYRPRLRNGYNKIGRVRPFVCMFLNQLTFDLNCLHVYGS